MLGRIGMPGRISRWTAVVAATVLVTLAPAGPASAHVEVSADKPQAGASNVTVSFDAEAESKTVGIVSLRVVLPAGIKPADVALKSGPAGWTLKPEADGYTVAGPAVPPGQNAKYAVTVAQLPTDATSLAFKTLQTYSDGHVDRWIEIPAPGAAKPDNPAPVLTLQPAAAPSPAASASPASSPAAPPSSAAAAAPDTASGDTDPGGLSWPLVAVALLVVAGAVAVVFVLRRRSARSTQ